VTPRATTALAVVAIAALTACAPSERPEVARGRSLFSELGCIACHRTDPRATLPTIGPSLARLVGREETFDDGTRGVVDEAYLRESLRDPDARTVAGFQRGVMSAGLGSARDRIKDETVLQALVAYIASLR
jgi:cytochrome c oxidase subunit 2